MSWNRSKKLGLRRKVGIGIVHHTLELVHSVMTFLYGCAPGILAKGKLKVWSLYQGKIVDQHTFSF